MIDLSKLPPPDLVEPLDFESILAERKARLLALTPEADRAALAAALELESEPIAMLLQENAYRELTLRARINDAARGIMLATATGADLDNLAALLGVARLTISAGDPAAVPPVAPEVESDESLRRRAQLAIESATVAGSRGAYEFHALGASADVADVAVDSPMPGEVRVVVLSRSGTGEPSALTLAAVQSALSAEEVRPLCDYVSVEGAWVTPFAVQAKLIIQPGPAPSTVAQQARAALEAYLQRPQRIGASVPLSAIYAALHQPGVARVELTTPAADINIGPREAAHCVSIALTAEAMT